MDAAVVLVSKPHPKTCCLKRNIISTLLDDLLLAPVHRVQIIERKEREERRKKTYVIPDPRETTNER